MRQVVLTIAIIMIILNMACAQDYQTFNANRIAYYGDQCQNIKCVRIDSTASSSDSIYYPFTVMQEAEPGCFSPWVASWIGPRIIIRENGVNLFFNRNNDTITIKTRAGLNEGWIAYYFEDSSVIEASIVKHDTLKFLGLHDSVKTIAFQVYDKMRNPVDHDINNMTLQISKSYGVVKTLNFFLFPDFEIYFPPDQLDEYELAGLSNPKTGVQNITWFDVYDFQPGDELHILYQTSAWCAGYSETDKSILKYIERVNYEDSIVYSYSVRQSVYKSLQDSSRFSYYEDTVKSVIQYNADFDKLPGEPVVTDYMAFSFYMTPSSKTNPRAVEVFFFNGDSCWFMPVIDGCINYENYLKGLGGPYYNNFGSERNLVYYKKGETELGVPLVITKVPNYESGSNILVSPNPASGFIKINVDKSYSGKMQITLFNLYGSVVFKEDIDNPEKLINIETLNRGVYFYRVTEKERVVYSGKLLIK